MTFRQVLHKIESARRPPKHSRLFWFCQPNEFSFSVCEYCAKLPATQNMRLDLLCFCFLHERKCGHCNHSRNNNDKIIIAKCSHEQNLTLRQTINSCFLIYWPNEKRIKWVALLIFKIVLVGLEARQLIFLAVQGLGLLTV